MGRFKIWEISLFVVVVLLGAIGCIFESEEEIEEFPVWRCGIIEEQPNAPAKCIVPYNSDYPVHREAGCEMCQDPREFYSAAEIEAHPLLWDIPLIVHTHPSKEVCEENCLGLIYEAVFDFNTGILDTIATYPTACFGYADTTCVRADN